MVLRRLFVCAEFTVQEPQTSPRMNVIGQIKVPFKGLARILTSNGLKDNFAHPDYRQTALFGVKPELKFVLTDTQVMPAEY